MMLPLTSTRVRERRWRLEYKSKSSGGYREGSRADSVRNSSRARAPSFRLCCCNEDPTTIITYTYTSASHTSGRGENRSSSSNGSVAQWLLNSSIAWSPGGGWNHHRPQLWRGRAVIECLEALGRSDRVVHKLGRARNPERATESWKREGRMEEQREMALSMAVKKSSRATVHAPSHAATAKPGWSNTKTDITNKTVTAKKRR